jgi:hypothetical protein
LFWNIKLRMLKTEKTMINKEDKNKKKRTM